MSGWIGFWSIIVILCALAILGLWFYFARQINDRTMKIAKRLLGCCFILLISIIFTHFSISYLYGFEYFDSNSNYQLVSEKTSEEFSFSFDFTSPDTLIGNCIYDLDGHQIIVTDVTDIRDWRCTIKFEARGIHNKKGGTLLSPCGPIVSSSSLEILPNNIYGAFFSAQTSTFKPYGNTFSITIYALEVPPLNNTATVTLKGLNKYSFIRNF